MPKKSATRKNCQKKVSDKIAINTNEYKEGRFTSRQQAIAVAYSQVSKKYPNCKPFLKKSARKPKKSAKKSVNKKK